LGSTKRFMTRDTCARVTVAVLIVAALLAAVLAVTRSGRVAASVDTSSQVSSGELAQNGGFESGTAPWQNMPNSNLAVYANGQIAGDNAFAGDHYGATNTSAPGGGIFEDISGLTIDPGDNFCGNVELRGEGNETGASGDFTIWLLGGGASENSEVRYSTLGNGANWQQFSTCITATTAHSTLRIQFYPTPNSPTVNIDAVDVHDAMPVPQNVAQNGGFESGTAPWQNMPNSNFAVYANGQIAGDNAYAGNSFGATNTSAAGGGIFQDVSDLTIEPGDTFCGSAELRSEGSATGASGEFTIWLMGGSSNQSGGVSYSNLGVGANWAQFSTCVTATTVHPTLRIQFYPTPNAPTVNIDAVNVSEELDVQYSVAQNGGFESGTAPWQEMPSSNLAVYANGQTAAENAYAGDHYGATNTSASGGGIFQDVSGLTIEPGDTFCGNAELRSEGNKTGASGEFTIWLLGGSGNENGNVRYSNLGDDANWQQVSTCVTATTAHSTVRIQFYPTPNSPTVDIDAVNVANVSGSVPNPNCSPNDSCTPQTFADTLLSQSGINAPITASNEFALETWALAEGGGAGCPGQPPNESPWQNSAGPAGNPLNTTQPEPGSTNWNSVGVKIYADGNGQTCWYWGVLATTQTITGSIGNYGPIISALQNPVLNDTSQCDRVATAVGNSEWGTGNFSADC
jgi:hypothetical protein